MGSTETERAARIDPRFDAWQARALMAEDELEQARMALFKLARALDTMHRVARAFLEPTNTSIDGEDKGRWPQAKHELAEARELSDLIFASIWQSAKG